MISRLRHSVYEVYEQVGRLRRSFSTRGLILMYHRISTVAPDPWDLCVSPAHFEEHLQVLCKDFQVLTLQQFVQTQQENRLPHRAVAITFDDGYADNLYEAQPLLEKYDLPATFFVSSGYLGQEREFWWDELGRHVLESDRLPPVLSLNINGARFEWHLQKVDGDAPLVPNQQQGRAKKRVNAPHSRLELYQDIWQHLYPLPHEVRQGILTEIAAWMGSSTETRDSHRIMTHKELGLFAQSPLVEIGGHTITHTSLAAHSASVQGAEIRENKRQLETIVEHPIKTFSYPHGDYTPATIQLLRTEGFSSACTVEAQPVWRGSHRFQLPRYGVGNWDGEEFAKRLHRWLA